MNESKFHFRKCTDATCRPLKWQVIGLYITLIVKHQQPNSGLNRDKYGPTSKN